MKSSDTFTGSANVVPSLKDTITPVLLNPTRSLFPSPSISHINLGYSSYVVYPSSIPKKSLIFTGAFPLLNTVVPVFVSAQ